MLLDARGVEISYAFFLLSIRLAGLEEILRNFLLCYFGMKTWNELPKCIINSPSVESFKFRLNTFLRSYEYQ